MLTITSRTMTEDTIGSSAARGWSCRWCKIWFYFRACPPRISKRNEVRPTSEILFRLALEKTKLYRKIFLEENLGRPCSAELKVPGLGVAFEITLLILVLFNGTRDSTRSNVYLQRHRDCTTLDLKAHAALVRRTVEIFHLDRLVMIKGLRTIIAWVHSKRISVGTIP